MKSIPLTTIGLVLLVTAYTFAQQSNPAPGPATGTPRICANFIDADGDGICDNHQAGAGQKRGKGYGPGDGTGNAGNGPKDGTGFGPGNGSGSGPGTCTGGCQGGGRRGSGRGPRR